MKENGLFYPDGSFKSTHQLRTKRDIIPPTPNIPAQPERGSMDQPQFLTPVAKSQDFDYWTDRLNTRQSEYLKTSEIQTNHVEIRLPRTSTIALIGDTHAGSPYVNYERIHQEINAVVAKPDTYAILLGDIIDGFFFNPAQFEQIEQVPEQLQYNEALLRHLARNKKLLVGFGGDHCLWGKKMGYSAYSEFHEKTGAYYLQGLGFISIHIGENEYRIAGAHRLPGNSIYNRNHPQMRAAKFGGAMGSDVVVSAHTHQKQISVSSVQEFGGVSSPITFISIGPYKAQDDYSRKLGFAVQTPQDMFGCAIRLDEGRKRVTAYYDILEAVNG